MKRIAFIGLGIMGGGMAATLLRSGYELTIWSRNADQSKPLLKMGAKAAPDIAAAVKDAEVVMYSLSDDRAIDAVVFGSGGVWSLVRRGQSPIPGFAAIRETIKSALNQGWGEENASAMIRALEQQGNVQVGQS